MTINTELFQKIYDQISQHPETHDQATFEYRDISCGTTRCVAGWAVAIAHGIESIYTGAARYGGRETVHGYLSSTANEAAALLGLDDAQACHLFYMTTDAQAVEACHLFATKGDEA